MEFALSSTAPEVEEAAEATTSSALSFSIERSSLLKVLGHIQSVVERRNTIPILSNVKLEAKEGKLKLTATDMEIAITEQVDAEISEEGELTVPAHTFYDIVRKLPDGVNVQFTGNATQSGKVEIKAGSCKFSLSCLPVSDFPVMDKGNLEHEFILAPSELTELLEKPRFAISSEETRYYLNGIYLHTINGEDNKKQLCAVATDGHRLAKISLDAPEGSENIPGVIIPKKTVSEVKKLVDESESDVIISLSGTKICFDTGGAVILSKLIDGTFPDYEKVIPSDNNKLLEVSTVNLVKAVDRVSTISSEKTRAIKLAIEGQKLILSATNEENGTANEEIDISYDFGDFEVGFNARYLLEMMSGIEGDIVQFVFADENAPTLVKDPSNPGVLYVIMPMRI
ncbi:DNA polymerase III subunit beta [Rickettsiales bacterium]|nr:DNA polymerase III subunit beta [Rickettsiales bacterium]